MMKLSGMEKLSALEMENVWTLMVKYGKSYLQYHNV